MKESYFVSKYINPLLNKHLSFFINITVDNAKYKGVADIIGMTKRGQFIGIEIKNETRLAEPEQVEWIDKIRENGGLGYIVFMDKGIGKRAYQNRIDKGYIPFSQFEDILIENNK